MRYAVVVEKAGSNYSAYTPDLPDALPRATLLKKQNRKFARLSSFILMGCAKMACLFLRQPVWWNISK